MKAKDRIIVALDVSSLDKALELVGQLKDHVGLFKVGLELLTNDGGPKVVKAIQKEGGKVFYDGKFKDIPNTVAGASRAVADLEVYMFNVHASGGIEMMKAAVDVLEKEKIDFGGMVLAVTVLTFLSEEDAQLIYGQPSKTKVVQFARYANIANIDGLICSPKELSVLAQYEEFKDLLKVIPGIRPKWAQKGDQKRVMTPGEAVLAGADYLVIGRPIRQPPKEIGNPVDAAKKIAEEIKQALEEKGD